MQFIYSSSSVFFERHHQKISLAKMSENQASDHSITCFIEFPVAYENNFEEFKKKHPIRFRLQIFFMMLIHWRKLIIEMTFVINIIYINMIIMNDNHLFNAINCNAILMITSCIHIIDSKWSCLFEGIEKFKLIKKLNCKRKISAHANDRLFWRRPIFFIHFMWMFVSINKIFIYSLISYESKWFEQSFFRLFFWCN